MGVRLKKQRDGKWRKHWYGEYDDGNRTEINLNVPWRGNPPESGLFRELGDADFEKSRLKAEFALTRHVEELRHKGRADHLTERLIESKTGKTVEYVKLSALAARWRVLPRETAPGKDWLAWCDSIFNRFAAAFPKVTYLHEITSEQAGEYRNRLAADYSRRTARGATQMLKGAFARLLPVGTVNPFAGAIARPGPDDDAGVIHRRPFTPEELQTLFVAARKDDFLYPLVVCAACTGMRRGDVCRLKWQSVHLEADPKPYLAIKTHKTGAAVEIPIFHQLREVLDTARRATRSSSGSYVWPLAARMLADNPDGLTWRFKKLVAETFPTPEATQRTLEATQPAPLAESLPAVEKAVCERLEGTRRDRVVSTLRRYAAGESVRTIGRPSIEGGADHRGQVSMDLREAEVLSGISFMPRRSVGPSMKDEIAAITRTARPVREKGNRSASILDWHAMRVTWVTLALAAGVPIETARLVTGHQSVNVVLKHYFKPGREALRSMLLEKMPAILTGEVPSGPMSPTEELVALVTKLSAGSATKGDKARLRLLAAKV